MDREALLRITAIASHHHGAFTRKMALDAGATASMLDRRTRTGEWLRPYEGVYVVAGSASTWERAVVTAVFASGPGAVASHATAAHIWGISGRPRTLEVTSSMRGRPDRPHVIHRSSDLEQQDVDERVGIPVTSVARTLVDMGVPWGEAMAARALDEAQRKELTDLRSVASVLHRVARKGRRGAGVMRLILEDRLGWAAITQSQLEAEFLRILRVAGVELPVSQARIVKRGGRIVARVDFVYLDVRLIIELDGERYHTDRSTFRSDRRRQNELIQEGYRILRFTAWDVFAAPDYVIAQVVAARRITA
jgi:very-short-patch-repair endonuclease